MKNYIAKIKDHQSIIYLADNDQEAITWANELKRDIYGENSELISIWNHDDNKKIEV